MQLSLETKALGWALLASLISLGGVRLVASPIQMMTGLKPFVEESMEISTSRDVLNQGNKYFGESCSICHGDDAHGEDGPDLHNLTISNAHITRNIKSGIKGEMPSFAKKYNSQQIAAIVSYLRSLK